MKGSVSLNPKYSSLHIKPTRILKTTPLIACDQRHLYFKSSKSDSTPKSIRWQDKNVINCTYLKKYNIILLLCENYRVYALTQNLQEITNMTGWQSKYTLAFQYIEEYGILLLIGAESVEIMKVSIQTNIKKTKFLSSMKFSLRKVTPEPIPIASFLPWNKGYGFNTMYNLLYVWSPQSIAFFELSSHTLLSQSHSLTKKQHPITCCYFSSSFKYTITGTSCGQIRVWRLPLSQRFQHENVLIHTFEAHVKPIKQIVQSKYSQKIIMTSGEDLLVCVWSLETFQMLRRFQFFGTYGEVFVKSIDESFVIRDGVLGELNFGQSLQFITQVNSNILMVIKQTIYNEDAPSSNIHQNGSITLTLQENLGVVFDSSLLLKAKQLNKMQTKHIYPPLKAKSIRQVVSSPFISTNYYLLAENGELFKVVVPPFSKDFIGASSKIEEVYNIEFSVDKEKHPFNQSPNVIAFLDILPTQFDSQIRDVEENAGKSFRHAVEEKTLGFNEGLDKFYQLQLITIGCSKGSVIFLSCKDMTKIYCRLTYHRDRIISIQSIKQYKTADLSPMNGMVATYCAENYLKLIKFDYKKSSVSCLLTYFAGQELKWIKGFDNFMIPVFYKGEFEVTEIDLKGKTEEFCCRRPISVDNHEGEILAIDYQSENELILTAASDNKIKIWTTKKILIYDVLLDEGLSYAFFVPHLKVPKSPQDNIIVELQKKPKQEENNQQKNLNSVEMKLIELMKRPRPQPVNFDMIILHGQKLLYFHHIPLSFRPQQIQNYNSNSQLLDDQKITLREVFEGYNQKAIEQTQQNMPTLKTQKKINETKMSGQLSRKRQRMQTQPSNPNNNQQQSLNYKKFFVEQSRVNNQSYLNLSPVLKNGRMKTQSAIRGENDKNQGYSRIKEPQYRISTTQKKKQKKAGQGSNNGKGSKSLYKSLLQRPPLISQTSIDATKRHIEQLHALKHQINSNHPFLPKINNKKEDIFDQFMRQKLINKNVLTRRDITINRIIMKNIIREHFTEESKISGLRLEY